VGYVVDKMALGHVFFQVFCVSSANYHPGLVKWAQLRPNPIARKKKGFSGLFSTDKEEF
jgi:hypothetical protein